MKKVFIAVFSLIALVFSTMLIGVNAHPGGTDGSGGHRNRSTGDYHYHHGYSAHDHYDMDGDGDIDCPYDFKDKTEHQSSSKTSSSESASKGKPPKTYDWSSVILGILAVGVYIFFMFILPFL